jgi:hypothetical protein
MKPFSVVSLLLPVVGILAGQASAASMADVKTSQVVWRQMDNCKRLAVRQYPDYTPQSLAQRERAAQRCFDNARLPPVVPQALSPAPAGDAPLG